MTETTESLSTSSLAKRLRLPIQQLFVTLRDYGWIERQEDAWRLTAKGELHGGAYQNSSRFGRYIVWPESLMEHPLITAIESNQRVSPGGMQRYYPHLSARQINRALCELGLQKQTRAGLEVTELGKRFGGLQDRDEDHALAVVSWPHELVDNPVIHRELNRLVGDGAEPTAAQSGERSMQNTPPSSSPDTLHAEQRAAQGAAPGEATAAQDDTRGRASGNTGDLFANDESPASLSDEERVYRSLDGRSVASLLQLRVCDWLYEAQLAHAYQRRLPIEEELCADFYVPIAGLYVECWEREVPTGDLTRRLRVREVCRDLGLAYLEVAAADIDRIDELLSKHLEPYL